MSRKAKTPTIVRDCEFQWIDDDFNLDSFGVGAPQREVFEMFAELGRKPEEVNEVIREKYAKYLERIRKEKESEANGRKLKSASRATGD
jgi:hypothetical protein